MAADGTKEEEFLYLLTEGSDLLRAGSVANARDYFERALLLEPGNEQALNLLGLALHRLEHFKEAQAIFRDLIHNNPVEPSLRLNLAMVLLKTNDLEGARRELEVVIDLNPDHPRAASYMGLVHERREAFASAALWYERAGNQKRAMQMRTRADAALQGGLGAETANASRAADPSFLDGAPVVDEEAERSTANLRAESSTATVRLESDEDEQAPAIPKPSADEPPPLDEEAMPEPPPADSVGLRLELTDEHLSMPVVDLDGNNSNGIASMGVGGKPGNFDDLPVTDPEARSASMEKVPSQTQEFTAEAIRMATVAVAAKRLQQDQETQQQREEQETKDEVIAEPLPTSAIESERFDDLSDPQSASEAESSEVGFSSEQRFENRDGDVESLRYASEDASEDKREEASEASEDARDVGKENALSSGAEAAALTAARADALRKPNEIPDEGSAQQARSASLGFTLDVDSSKQRNRSNKSGGESFGGSVPRGGQSVSDFASQNDAHDGAEVLHRRDDGAVVVPVDEVAYLRTDLLVSLTGQFEIEPLNRRYRGRRTDSLFGGNGAPMVAVMGQGTAVYDPNGLDVTVLDLTNEELYLVEGALASFSAGLVWENGRLPSEGGPDLDIVHLRGTGAVVLGNRKKIYAHAVLPDAPVTLHVERLVGWNGQVVPYRGDLPGLPEQAKKPAIVRFEGNGLVFGI